MLTWLRVSKVVMDRSGWLKDGFLLVFIQGSTRKLLLGGI